MTDFQAFLKLRTVMKDVLMQRTDFHGATYACLPKILVARQVDMIITMEILSVVGFVTSLVDDPWSGCIVGGAGCHGPGPGLTHPQAHGSGLCDANTQY